MSVNAKQLKQFLQSKEFSIVVERIVSIYSRTLLKKIQSLEDQLANVVNLNENLTEKLSKCEISSESVRKSQPNIDIKDNNVRRPSKNQNVRSDSFNCVNADKVYITDDNLKDLNNNDVEDAVKVDANDKHSRSEREHNLFNFENIETASVQFSEQSSETSSPYTFSRYSSSDGTKTERVLFDKEIFMKYVHLPKRDYDKCMVLGVYSRSCISDKIVFEDQRKRYWIHLENCKPRSRSEKIVKSRLEEALPGN